MPLPRIRQRIINGYQHIMACPIARAWVLLVTVHFIVQVALQSVTLRDNQQAKDKTSLCLSLANVPVGVPLMEDGNLSLCNGIPGHTNVTCTFIASSKNSAQYSTLSEVDVGDLADFDLDQIMNITISGQAHLITGRCAVSLQYMYDAFRNDAAEDIGTICFQFWLLIVSLLAVLQDSIPHLAVCIASHLLDVGWAGFRIKTTIALRDQYYTYILNGACTGDDMLGNWWERRLGHAAPLFATNVITLILLAALSLFMFRTFAKINFCRMGPSPSISRMYKIALSFSAFLQLAAFFTILAVGMWIDLLSCDVVAALDGNVRSDQTTFFVLAVIIAPWFICGWWAIFREVEWAFILFGVFHAFLLALWPGMFASAIFRYVLKTWSFFACVSVVSYIFVVATAITAVICRLHFGKGLGHFLRVESELSSSGFPASFFTNDPAEPARGGSSASFDFDFMDTEKGRKGSMYSIDDGPMDIGPFTPESSKYSAHTLSFEAPKSKSAPESPIMIALPRTRLPNPPVSQALNKRGGKALPPVTVDSEPQPPSYTPRTYSNGPHHVVTSTTSKKKPFIRPLPKVYLQDPYRETRTRKETPSLLTQATGISTISCSEAVVTLARKDPVLSATARTVATSTTYSRRSPSPVDAVMPHENRPSIDLGTKGRFIPQPDSHGRI